MAEMTPNTARNWRKERFRKYMVPLFRPRRVPSMWGGLATQCRSFFPKGRLRQWWGGPPGPRPTPSSACRTLQDADPVVPDAGRGRPAQTRGAAPQTSAAFPVVGKISGIGLTACRGKALPLARLRIALPVGGGAAEIADGFPGAGAIQIDPGETRIVLDGRVVVGQGQTIFLAAEMDATAPVQGRRQFGLQPQGPLEIDQGVRIAAQTNQADASRGIGVGHFRVETNGLRIIPDGCLILPQVLLGRSPAVVGRGVIGTERDGLREGLNGGAVFPALHLLTAAMNGVVKRRRIRAGLGQRRRWQQLRFLHWFGWLGRCRSRRERGEERRFWRRENGLGRAGIVGLWSWRGDYRAWGDWLASGGQHGSCGPDRSHRTGRRWDAIPPPPDDP